MTKIEKRTLFTLFIMLIFGVALGFSTSFNEVFLAPKRFLLRLFTSGIFIFWIWMRLKYRISLPKSPVVTMSLGYFFIMSISMFFSRDLFAGFAVWSDQLCFIIIFLVMASLFQWDDALKTVPFLQFLGVIVAVYSVIQHLGLDPVGWTQGQLVRDRSISTMGNPDFLSSFLVLLIPLLFCRSFTESRDKRERGFLSLFCWGLLCAVNLGTYSRAGLGGMIAGMVFVMIFMGVGVFRKHRMKTVAMVVILILAVLSIFYLQFSGKTSFSIGQRVSLLFTGRDSNVTTRVYLWNVALKVISENILLGTGPDTFNVTYLPYRCLEPEEIRHRISMPGSAHNLFLDMALASGIFAPLFFIIMLFFLFRDSIRKIRISEGDGERSFVALGFLGGILGYLIHHMASFPTLPDELIFWIFAGFCVVFISGKDENIHENSLQTVNVRFGGKMILLLTAVVGIFFVYISFRSLISDYCLAQGHVYQKVMGMAPDYQHKKYYYNVSREYLERSIDLNRLNYRSWLALGKLMEEFSLWEKEPDYARKLAEMGINAYRKAISLGRFNPYPYADLGRLLSKWNLPRQAVIEYGKALALDPYNAPLITDLAAVYVRMGEYDKAEKLFRKALEIYPLGAWTYGNLGVFYYERNNWNDAVRYLKTAHEMEPDNEKYIRFLKKMNVKLKRVDAGKSADMKNGEEE